jgi:murein DD-endopeptidase MepM/ murein hydrolase activator NlpD
VQLGWRGWWKTVGVTFALTSIFWVVLGGRFWSLHLRQDGTVMPAAASSAKAGLIIPVAGVKKEELTDNFAQARADGARTHEAIDIMAPEGTAITAATRGRVEKLFVSGAGGNTVYQRSPDGRTIYYYAHLGAYAAGLKEGAELNPGDPVGTVGHTGNADAAAPHLHFAIWRTAPDRKWWEDAEAVDPYPLLGGRQLTP